MKKSLCFMLFFACFLVASPLYAGIWGESVSYSDLHDGRSFDSGGLAGYWPSDFTIHWDIDQDPLTSVWTYQYTLSSSLKDVSHFILELTGEGNFIDYDWGTGSVEFGVWDGSNGNSDPEWPEGSSFYGVKYDYGGSTVTYTLQTTRDPVWGNFYTKSGKHKGDWVYAHNWALGLEGFESDDKLDFIVRPDGGTTPPVVPEPASSLLFITGGVVFAYRRYVKKSTRQ